MKERGYEFSFAWLFAILIGAFVMFLAVYLASQLVEMKRFEGEAKVGKQLGTLLTPIETNLEEAKFSTILVPEETRIFNGCTNASNNFGTQGIAASVKASFGETVWQEDQGVQSNFNNKYLFSNKTVHGRNNFYVLTKPFRFPYKIADLVIMWSDTEKYCFINAPPVIEEEIEKLSLADANIEHNNNINSCGPESIKVCFSPVSHPECKIKITVFPDGKEVQYPMGRKVTYAQSFDTNDHYALLYAAIFSDPDVYECQVDRLMYRAARLAEVYKQKANYFAGPNANCLGSASLINSNLDLFGSAANALSSSKELLALKLKAENVKDTNDDLTPCRLF